jgi:hypothetical protein
MKGGAIPARCPGRCCALGNLLVRRVHFDELEFVTPAQAGIQKKSAMTCSYPPWLPACAGMTRPRSSHHLYCGCLHQNTPIL